jgi:hypothetical protein
LNFKLDGEWTLQTIDDLPLPNGFSRKMIFEKDGAHGDISITTIDAGQTEVLTGTYSLIKTYSITVAIPNNSTTDYLYDTDVYDVRKFSKTELQLFQKSTQKVLYFTK